jgi:YhcH/YjgK/YiaL family protein
MGLYKKYVISIQEKLLSVVDESDIFYNVSQYETKLTGEVKFEAHRRYIDIQYMLEGQEMMGYANIEDHLKKKR